MDTPNEPEPESNGHATAAHVDATTDLNQQALAIAEVVKRDRKRRRRTSKIMLAFILLTLGLAGVVLAFGRSDTKVMKDTVNHQVGVTVDREAPILVTREIERQLPTTIEMKVSPIIAQTVEKQIDTNVTPEFNRLAAQIAAIDTKDASYSEASLSDREMARIKKVIRDDVPTQATKMTELANQMNDLKIAFYGGDVASWGKERAGFTERLTSLETNMNARTTRIEQLSEKLDLVLKQLNQLTKTTIDPCLQESELEASSYRNYSVKENTTSPLYFLNFKVRVKGIKDGTVRGLTIMRDNTVLLTERDVMMGATVSFDDNVFRYSLIPVFINKRLLANDFIGLAISRARKCAPKK